MRLGSPFSLLLAVLAGSGLLSTVRATAAGAPVAAAAAAVDAADALPEVLELTAKDFHEKTKKGYW